MEKRGKGFHRFLRNIPFLGYVFRHIDNYRCLNSQNQELKETIQDKDRKISGLETSLIRAEAETQIREDEIEEKDNIISLQRQKMREQRKEQYNSILDVMKIVLRDEAYVIIGKRGEIIEVSEQACKLVKCERTDILNQHYSCLLADETRAIASSLEKELSEKRIDEAYLKGIKIRLENRFEKVNATILTISPFKAKYSLSYNLVLVLFDKSKLSLFKKGYSPVEIAKVKRNAEKLIKELDERFGLAEPSP